MKETKYTDPPVLNLTHVNIKAITVLIVSITKFSIMIGSCTPICHVHCDRCAIMGVPNYS